MKEKWSRRLLESTERVRFPRRAGGCCRSEAAVLGPTGWSLDSLTKVPLRMTETPWESYAFRLPNTTGAKETRKER
jgi:hypothetical protein